MTDQLPQIDVQRIAVKWMGFVDSYISGSAPGPEFPLLTSSTTMGTVLGVYLNNKQSFVVVTSRGLSILFNEHQYFVAYTDIAQITEPNEDDRDLDVLVESIDASGDSEGMEFRSYLIPVLGMTNGVPDILEFYGFLSQVVQESHIIPIELKDVGTRADVVAYLRTQCEWKDYVDALVGRLENDLDAESLDQLAIDKTLFGRPDFWRAVAFIFKPPLKF